LNRHVPSTKPQVGTEALDFTLASPGRGTIRLSDYRGQAGVPLVFLRGFG
jgi:peroxiredoxin